MSALKRPILSEGTLMPLSLVVTVALSVAWISDVAAQVKENARQIEAAQVEMNKLSEMRERLARVEAKIDFLVKVEGLSK